MMSSIRLSEQFIAELHQVSPNQVFRNVDLAKVTRWKVGGVADCVVAPTSIEQVAEVIRLVDKYKVQYVVFAGTTNLLFADEGLRALGIYIGPNLNNWRRDGNEFYVESGVWAPKFSSNVARCGFAGLEHICGIPATIGGLVYMNGGSQRRSISENLVSVDSVDAKGVLVERSKHDCSFSYRYSGYQELNEVIVGAKFRFDNADSVSQIRRRMLKIFKERRIKFPSKLPNCGSVFKVNRSLLDEVGPPGMVLEKLGFKGKRIGGAEVSVRHANFINNVGGAKASDILELVVRMKNAVNREYGYELEVEAKFVSPCGALKSIA